MIEFYEIEFHEFQKFVINHVIENFKFTAISSRIT